MTLKPKRIRTRPLMIGFLIFASAVLGTAEAAPEPWAETDRDLERAESFLQEWEGGFKGCQKEFSVEKMLRGFEKTEIPVQAGPYIHKQGMADLTMYYMCKVYSLKDPSLCKELEVFRGGFDFFSQWAPDPIVLAEECHVVHYEALLARAKIKGEPDVAQLCEKQENLNKIGDRMFRPKFLKQGCRMMHESSGTAKDICRSLKPFFEDNNESLICEDYLLSVMGDPQVCRRLRPSAQEKCREFGAFRKAFQAGEAAACGDHPVCRAMMGEAGACEPYAERIKAGFCALHLDADYVDSRRQQIVGLIDVVGLKLAEDASTLKGQEGFERRRKRLADLTARAMRHKDLGL